MNGPEHVVSTIRQQINSTTCLFDDRDGSGSKVKGLALVLE